MSGRIAIGAAAWSEPVIAVALTIAAIAGLGVLAGRVYAGAILHTGPTLKLSDGWPAGRAAAVRSGSCVSRELRPVPWHAAG